MTELSESFSDSVDREENTYYFLILIIPLNILLELM